MCIRDSLKEGGSRVVRGSFEISTVVHGRSRVPRRVVGGSLQGSRVIREFFKGAFRVVQGCFEFQSGSRVHQWL